MCESITGLDPLPSNPNVLRIRVGGRIAARLSRADVDALELTIGQLWTAKLQAAVQRAVDLAKSRKAALSILGRRAMSVAELIQRLQSRGHEPSIVTQVAEQLEADGWLDDRAYASSIAHEVTRHRPASNELLIDKLRQRGIPEDVANQVAHETASEQDPIDAAADFAKKKLRSMKSLSSQAAARRIAGALGRRGFDDDAVATVMHRLKLVPEDS